MDFMGAYNFSRTTTAFDTVSLYSDFAQSSLDKSPPISAPSSLLEAAYNETLNDLSNDIWAESINLNIILEAFSPFLREQVDYIEDLTRKGPIEHLFDPKIPNHIKILDLTIRTFGVGTLELIGNSLLAFVSTTVTICLFTATLIFLLGKSFDTADQLADYAKDMGRYSLSYINQALRGGLKMIIGVGPTLTKLLDVVEVLALKAIFPQPPEDDLIN